MAHGLLNRQVQDDFREESVWSESSEQTERGGLVMGHLIEALQKGGYFMWPIFGVSIAGMAIVLERFFALYMRYRMDGERFVGSIVGSIDSRQYNRAVGFCNDKASNPLSRVLKAGLLKANKSDKEIERAMEEEILRVAPLLQKRIDFLNMFGNIATLLGLLGTLVGLSTAFEGIGAADAATRAGLLAKGVSETMMTTAAGLLVAIPMTVFFHVLQNRANAMVEFIQESAITILNHMSSINREMAASEHPRKVSKLG